MAGSMYFGARQSILLVSSFRVIALCFYDLFITFLSQQLFLVLRGRDRLPGLRAVVYLYHAADIQRQATDDDAEHQREKHLGMPAGETLRISGGLVDFQQPGPLASGTDLLLVPFGISGVVFVRHLLSEYKFLPSHDQ